MTYKQLKLFAVCCMVFDHVTHLFPIDFWLAPLGDRLWSWSPAVGDWFLNWVPFGLMFIGRLAAPIFLFCIANGFVHSRDRKRYCLRILLAAAAAQVPYVLFDLAENRLYGIQGDWRAVYGNILFTLALGLAVLMAWEVAAERGRLWLGVLAAVGAALLAQGRLEGGRGYILLILVFYLTRNWSAWRRALLFLPAVMLSRWGLMVWMVTEQSAGAVRNCLLNVGGNYLGMLVTLAYNGEKGNAGKGFQRFMYAFYPAHFLVLAVIGYLRPPFV